MQIVVKMIQNPKPSTEKPQWDAEFN